MFEIINNCNHKIIKFLKFIIINKKFRVKNQLIICECWNTFYEAINNNIKIKILLIYSEHLHKINNLTNLKIEKIYLINKQIMEKISDTKNSQGILFTIKPFDKKIINDLDLNNDILLIDNIQDPGNLGTILRTATAFNIKNIILTNHTTDYTSPKVIRSTVGSIFKLKIYLSNNILNVINFLKQQKFIIYSTCLDKNSININNVNFLNQKKVIIFGNESKGISKVAQYNTDFKIKIPIENVDSLNVAVSSGIIMYLMKNRENNI